MTGGQEGVQAPPGSPLSWVSSVLPSPLLTAAISSNTFVLFAGAALAASRLGSEGARGSPAPPGMAALTHGVHCGQPVWQVEWGPRRPLAQLGSATDRHLPFQTQTGAAPGSRLGPAIPPPGDTRTHTDLLRGQASWHGAQLRGWGFDVRNTDLQEPHVLLLRVTCKGSWASDTCWARRTHLLRLQEPEPPLPQPRALGRAAPQSASGVQPSLHPLGNSLPGHRGEAQWSEEGRRPQGLSSQDPLCQVPVPAQTRPLLPAKGQAAHVPITRH